MSEQGPSSEAFPNAWAKKKRAQPLAASDGTDGDVLTRVQLQYIGIDGYRYNADYEQGKGGQLCCLMCCPCAVGGCSEENQKQYRGALRSVTVWLAIVQIIYFIVSLGVGSVAPLSINPLVGPCPRAFFMLGGMNGWLCFVDLQLWRLVLPLLLHGGILHLLLNLWAEVRFGLYLERRMGLPFIAVLYVLGTIGGGLLSAAMTPSVISVGASAALMALMGAHAVEIVCKWHATHPLERKFALGQCILWICVTLALSAAPFVDAGAHIGGLLTGALLATAFFADQTALSRSRVIQLRVVGSLMSATYFVVLFAVLLSLPTTFFEPEPTDRLINFCG